MAETTKSVCDSPLTFSCEIGLRELNSEEEEMRFSEKDGFADSPQRSDSFVLDIESLTRITDKNSSASPRISLQRSLSRKGSQRGERKAAIERDRDASKKDDLVTVCTSEKNALLPMTEVTDPTNFQQATTDGRWRRFGKRSSWIDPRRILFFFATLSSMGTIILIYFTLSIGKISGGDAQAK
eukprot:TRINITY_DN1048_c0_g1_i2.p1 TRINITY_DN1048_c0_g1~~TRINITY_DN1048_c0_g1_i2.p1  ORF type:complete len:183 (-),score=37.50 TRINITY_DN1048_c0_g1_i2:278-826(-)